MEKRSAVFLTFLFVISIFFITYLTNVSAFEIKIKTLTNHSVAVNFLEPGEDIFACGSFYPNSGETGEISTNISCSKAVVDVEVVVRDKGVQVLYEKFTDYKTDSPYTLEVLPIELLNGTTSSTATNLTTNETASTTPLSTTNGTAVTGTEELSDTGVTGKSIFGKLENLKNINKIYYIIGLVLVIGIVLFFTLGRKLRSTRFLKFPAKEPKPLNVTKVSDIIREQKENATYNYRDVQAMESKIKMLQEELARLKYKERVNSAEKIFEQDRKEIDEEDKEWKRLMDK